MKEQFVPYEISLKLKELGFNEECFAYYRNRELYRWIIYECQFFRDQTYWLNSNCEINENCGAPLWQQAFEWFRINHKLDSYCRVNEESNDYYWRIIKLYEDHKIKTYSAFTYSYELAKIECLKKLIEIISEK